MNKLLSSFICLLLYNFISPSYSLPLCTDFRAPVIPKKSLVFCPYNGRVCCDSSKDVQLHKAFEGMKISDTSCSSAVKSILCSTCDQFAAELFKVKSGPRPVPVLCNSTVASANSFCSSVWDSCQNIPIKNSPFAPSLQTKAGVTKNANSSLLTDFWQSKADFCEAFGGNSDKGSLCFNGEQVSLKKNETLQTPNGMCFEKIADGAYLNMVPHPDGSNRAFFSNQAGKIWLATIPDQDSGESMGLDESSPFADLTDEVYLDARYGMMGMAFHPNFAKNGRFFASYNCDKAKSPSCAGRCACNSDVGCDPSKIKPEDNKQPCQYHSVVSEFSANGTASNPSLAENVKPSEVRRIFTMGLPFTANHGGQILFGPEDGYLYFMMGDGGSKGDSFNFAQNKKSLLGKIMRVDIRNHDDMPFEWPMDWFSSTGIPPFRCPMNASYPSESEGGMGCNFKGTTRLELMTNELEMNKKSYSKFGPKDLWPSVSNYVLKLSSTDDPESVIAYMYFLDSGGGSYPEVISNAQAEWFNRTSQEINPDSRVPEIIFWHIPSQAYKTVAPRFYAHRKCIGSMFVEKVASQEAELGMMKLLEVRSSVKAVFVGHNHGLDWCCPYKNLWLCYARHTGYGGYGNWPRGARILEITQLPFSLKSWIHMEDGHVHSEVLLSSTTREE